MFILLIMTKLNAKRAQTTRLTAPPAT